MFHQLAISLNKQAMLLDLSTEMLGIKVGFQTDRVKSEVLFRQGTYVSENCCTIAMIGLYK